MADRPTSSSSECRPPRHGRQRLRGGPKRTCAAAWTTWARNWTATWPPNTAWPRATNRLRRLAPQPPALPLVRRLLRHHASGGFDVIIGNPPYVERSKLTGSYRPLNLCTLSCRDIYAWVVERALIAKKRLRQVRVYRSGFDCLIRFVRGSAGRGLRGTGHDLDVSLCQSPRAVVRRRAEQAHDHALRNWGW